MGEKAKILSDLTDGKLQIEGLPTKSVVPHRETIDAVANGILDGDFNAIAYFAGRDPAGSLPAKYAIALKSPSRIPFATASIVSL